MSFAEESINKANQCREELVGKRFKHFKGNVYEVIEVGLSSSSCSVQVIYRQVDKPDRIWIRPYVEFMSKLNKNKYPNAEQEHRFEPL